MLTQLHGNYTIGTTHKCSGWDLALVKYDPNNKIVWSKKFGGGGTDYTINNASGLAVDSKNHIFVGATFNSTDLELGGAKKLVTAGSYDAFLTKRSP